ncbi:MAG: DNA polymerase III subunit delta' [Thermodesulfobacteriota bacterium]
MHAIVGHERIIETLSRSVRDGLTAHAYLFAGIEGIGKAQVALGFAAMLNCPSPTDDAQHTCSACRRVMQGSHPDVLVEKPDKGRIRIDRIRELQQFLAYAPIEGRCRVAFIDGAHAMNPAAQNALLKTLEEPPPRRVLILVTSNASALLPTVLSRCRRVKFGPLPREVISAYLQRDKRMDAQRAWTVAGMAGGSLARALETDTTRFLDLRDRLKTAITEPGRLGLKGLLELSAYIAGGEDMAGPATDMAASVVRDLLVGRVAPETEEVDTNEGGDSLRGGDEDFRECDLLKAYNEICRAAELVRLPMNLNKNLVMDVMLLKIARIMAGPSWGVAVHDVSAH